MIAPLTLAEQRQLLPEWAFELARAGYPLRVGIPVYDVLHGPKYGDPHGVIIKAMACDDVCEARGNHELFGHVVVRLAGGGMSASLAGYWVPDIETADGRDWLTQWLDERLTFSRITRGGQIAHKWRDVLPRVAAICDAHKHKHEVKP